jgi:hypothetical protein
VGGADASEQAVSIDAATPLDVSAGESTEEALSPREMLIVDAITVRAAELLRSDPPDSQLINAATLADALGVDRSYIYAHADELGAVRLGNGSKPRLRFELDTARRAMARYTSKLSQGSNTSAGAESLAPTGRRRRRLPNGLPEPGSVLVVRPQKT